MAAAAAIGTAGPQGLVPGTAACMPTTSATNYKPDNHTGAAYAALFFAAHFCRSAAVKKNFNKLGLNEPKPRIKTFNEVPRPSVNTILAASTPFWPKVVSE